MEHWYYLHTNGELIHKRTWPGEDGSDFVRRIWPCDPANRAHAWTIIVEALSLGAALDRVQELAAKWKCDCRDLTEFMVRITSPSEEQRRGIRLYLSEIAGVDPDRWFDWLGTTPKGAEPNFETMPTTTPARVS